MTQISQQEVVVVQYHKLVGRSAIEQAAADDHVLLAQQIEQVRVFLTLTGEVLRLLMCFSYRGGCAMQAYGPTGLGILTVSGVPGFTELRQRLLPLAQAFAVSPIFIH